MDLVRKLAELEAQAKAVRDLMEINVEIEEREQRIAELHEQRTRLIEAANVTGTDVGNVTVSEPYICS